MVSIKTRVQKPNLLKTHLFTAAASEMDREIYLGIDFGTQSVKCVFCELLPCDAQEDQQKNSLLTSGKILLTGKSDPLEVIQSQDGYAEQDPLLWIKAMKEAIANALTQDPTQTIRNHVKSIGISGQQHGLVALDAEDNIIRPCMLWCDTRAKLEAVELSSFSGRSIPPGFTAPKMQWMLRHEPTNFERAVKFLLPHDYINYYLSGNQIFAMECGDASGIGLIDFSTRDWDHKTIDFIHPTLRTKLPSTLSPADKTIGSVDPQIAMELGISNNGTIQIAPGCGDNAMTILGISAVSNSSTATATSSSPTPPLLISLGTSGTIMLTSSVPMVDPNGSVALFGDATGQWLSLVCLQNCSMVPDEIFNSFLTSNQRSNASSASISPEESVSSLRAQLIALASEVSPGSEGITLLPYFSSGGERTPNWPQASGCFLGLRHGHLQQPQLLYRAALEAVTYSLLRGYRDLSQLSASSSSSPSAAQVCGVICVVGGGAQNALWKQLLADIFELPVTSPHPEIGNHAAAIGAAVQAIATSRGIPFASVAIRSEEEVQRYLPRLTEATAEAYRRGYERHLRYSNLLFGEREPMNL
jgi:xylulokinase